MKQFIPYLARALAGIHGVGLGGQAATSWTTDEKAET